MPQLVPFYFSNEVIFTFLTLVILIYFFSKYLLPKIILLFTSRSFITKL